MTDAYQPQSDESLLENRHWRTLREAGFDLGQVERDPRTGDASEQALAEAIDTFLSGLLVEEFEDSDKYDDAVEALGFNAGALSFTDKALTDASGERLCRALGHSLEHVLPSLAQGRRHVTLDAIWTLAIRFQSLERELEKASLPANTVEKLTRDTKEIASLLKRLLR